MITTFTEFPSELCDIGFCRYLLRIALINPSDTYANAAQRFDAARPDKGYSLTDCISMQTMGSQGIRDVLTNDRHFEQEGFQALFRE